MNQTQKNAHICRGEHTLPAGTFLRVHAAGYVASRGIRRRNRLQNPEAIPQTELGVQRIRAVHAHSRACTHTRAHGHVQTHTPRSCCGVLHLPAELEQHFLSRHQGFKAPPRLSGASQSPRAAGRRREHGRAAGRPCRRSAPRFRMAGAAASVSVPGAALMGVLPSLPGVGAQRHL